MKIAEENQTFTFDHIFPTETKQEAIYNIVGKATVEDVLHGYNGTIFAYGQSGSGKTHTMFGPDIFDNETKGMIPRAAYDIFRVWDISPNVKEVEIRCSMLEIYMEHLRDLLTDDTVELKIKESPIRGIYVDGLSELALESEEELMYYIDSGEQRRVWAETRHNSVSSRSHTIFMIQVRQVFANETEWRGVLNLVDLAGSEKVGASGAEGLTFEEGTKINLSLSALGNVIHSLSLGLEHVPYRESKLTRLLQESLGGNYKTSLIVTCSPHSSQLAETLSTLKFAQRAKKLKNNAQVNIKTSPEKMMKLIEALKKELMEKEDMIHKLMNGELLASADAILARKGDNDNDNANEEENEKEEDNSDEEVSIHLPPGSQVEGKALTEEAEEKDLNQDDDDGSPKFIALKVESPEPSHKKTESSFTQLDLFQPESQAPAVADLTRKLGESEERCLKLGTKLKEAIEQVDCLKKEKSKLERKLKESEIEMLGERKKVIVAEEELTRLRLDIQKRDAAEKRASVDADQDKMLSKVYASQLKALTEALEDSDAECSRLLREKKEKLQQETVEVCNMSLADYDKLDKTQTLVSDAWITKLLSSPRSGYRI